MNKKKIQALLLVVLCSMSGLAISSSSYARYMARSGKNLPFLCVPVLQKTSKLAVMAYEDSLSAGESQFASLSYQAYEMLYKGEMLRRVAIQKNPGQLNESIGLFNTYSKQMTADELIELSRKCTESYAAIKKGVSVSSDDEMSVMVASEKVVSDIRSAVDEDFRLSLQAVVVEAPKPEPEQEVQAASPEQSSPDQLAKKEANPDYGLPLGMNEAVPIGHQGARLINALPSEVKPWTTANFVTFLSLTMALSLAIWVSIYGLVKLYECQMPRLRIIVRWQMRKLNLKGYAKKNMQRLFAKPVAVMSSIRSRISCIGKTKCAVTINHE